MRETKNCTTILLSLIFCLKLTSVQSQNLDTLLWKKRPLVLIKSGLGNSKFKEQLTFFKSFESELNERDVVIIVPDRGQRSLYKARFNLSESFSGIILIGKDGSVKMQKEFVVHPPQIFDRIDAMPMRRAEIKRKKIKH